MRMNLNSKRIIRLMAATFVLIPMWMTESEPASAYMMQPNSAPASSISAIINAKPSFELDQTFAASKKAIKKGKKLFEKNCKSCHNNIITSDLAGIYTTDQIYDSYTNVEEMQLLQPLSLGQLKKVIAYLATK